MKPNILDRIVMALSPKAGADRLRYRMQMDLAQRSYSGAQNYNWADWLSAKRTSANTETRKDVQKLRDRSRDLVRNSAYANKAVNVIVNNTVGAGIVPNIKGRNKTQEKAVRERWKKWGETTLCDKSGRNNFYGLQALAFRSTVESGEILGRKFISGQAKATQIQLMESDFVNTAFDNAADLFQGIKYDTNGKELVYNLYNKHPGDFQATDLKYLEVPASEMIRMFKRERPGQLQGVPWAYPVMETLNNLSDLQQATLVRQKVSACFAMFITEEGSDINFSATQLQDKRELESQLEPGSVRYLRPGQKLDLATPPAAEGYSDLNRETLKQIAAGFGVSYEALTGDYSNVNFSSGRMGHLEFQRNIDAWRWQIVIPQFCDPSFQWFLEDCELAGINTQGVTVEWTPPARELIDPTKEYAALKDAVRSGFKSLPEALREQGQDPDQVMLEIASTNKRLDELGITLDTDPRKLTQQGQNQFEPTNNSPAD